MISSPPSKSTDTPSASDTTNKARNPFTEESAKNALVEARGDLFVAAELIGITSMRLYKAIQQSTTLQEAFATARKAPKGVPIEAIREAVDERIALYRADGLDALHELATMPLDANSAQNQVKLAAAARLVGETASGGGGGELADALRELNQQYQQNAPRLRVIRERVTLETIPGERVVDEQKPQE